MESLSDIFRSCIDLKKPFGGNISNRFLSVVIRIFLLALVEFKILNRSLRIDSGDEK